MSHSTKLLVIATALAGGLMFAGAGSASAHDGLIASSPAAGSQIAEELTEVELTFSQELLTIGVSTAPFAVQVQGPDGSYFNRGCVAIDGSTVSTAVALGDSGEYTVLWQVVSSDGHSTSDSYAFSYERPENVDAAVGADSGVTCDPATGEAIEPAPSPASAEPGGSTPDVVGDDRPAESASALPWIIGGVGLGIVAVAGAALLVLRRRRA